MPRQCRAVALMPLVLAVAACIPPNNHGWGVAPGASRAMFESDITTSERLTGAMASAKAVNGELERVDAQVRFRVYWKPSCPSLPATLASVLTELEFEVVSQNADGMRTAYRVGGNRAKLAKQGFAQRMMDAASAGSVRSTRYRVRLERDTRPDVSGGFIRYLMYEEWIGTTDTGAYAADRTYMQDKLKSSCML